MVMTLGYTVLVLVIYVLACARLTRLANGDTILDPARKWIAGRSRDYERSASERKRWQTALYWLQCPWCIGMWICVGAAYLPVWLIGWAWWAVFPVGFAASHLVGVFAFAADTDPFEIEDA